MAVSASRGVAVLIRTAAVAIVLLFGVTLAHAQVTTSTTTNTYGVPGTTAKQVVQYMQSHPIRGDHGSAFANIRPRYTLTVKTAVSGSICRASKVAVKIHFTLTLPEATGTNRMSKRVRGAWNNFIGFVKRHEEHHRQSYIGCANTFVRAAKRETAPSCSSVEFAVRERFDEMKRDCEAKQVAWDRGQKGALRNQSIVRLAGY
jgi:predicted secreted Zn-dependent protease